MLRFILRNKVRKVLLILFLLIGSRKIWQRIVLRMIGWIVRRYRAPKTSSRVHIQHCNQLLTLSATELARRIRAGELTSREITEAFITQIRVVNPNLNAVVCTRFDTALIEASQCDAELKMCQDRNHLPPFFGVPCTTKEAFALTGMPHASGLYARKDRVSTWTSPVIQRMQDAGFVVLGVTNTSELCMWLESSNRVYGTTNNPYDHSRTSGGSSGGEAAIISALGSPCGLGSDVGGSIRLPAFFNGIFGHKPTGGCVPNTGQYPMSDNDIDAYCQPGPLCRRSEDLWPLLRVMAGPDHEGKSALNAHERCPWLENPLISPAEVHVPSLRIVSIHGKAPIASTALDPELVDIQTELERHFASQGCEVEILELPELKYGLNLWGAGMSVHGEHPFRELLANDPATKLWILPELMRMVRGRSKYTLPALGLAFVEQIFEWDTRGTAYWFKALGEFRAKVDALLEDGRTVLLYPPYTRPAPVHHTPKLSIVDFPYTAIFNALQLPVTSVPLGLTCGVKHMRDDWLCRGEAGLPLGIQVIGARGRDEVPIAVGMHLESAFGGWQAPSPDIEAL